MTIHQLQVAEGVIIAQGASCILTTKTDQSNKENVGMMQCQKNKGDTTKKVTAKKKREKKVDKDPEPPYVKSDYELYVEEKRRRNAEHMRRWDLKAAQAKQVNEQQEMNLPETKCYSTKTFSRTSDNTDDQRISNGDLPVALDFTTDIGDLPEAIDLTTTVKNTNQTGATGPTLSLLLLCSTVY